VIPQHIKYYCSGDRGFFIDFRTGELYRVNLTAMRIMDSLNSGVAQTQLPEIICSEFDVGYDQAKADIDQFIREFTELEPLK
jgi:Coenzyme PQQ synthesis protein D (PqqD)